ncbi:MAG: hypothetical protein ACR2PF_20300 [Rhizobiaceae bacterium]
MFDLLTGVFRHHEALADEAIQILPFHCCVGLRIKQLPEFNIERFSCLGDTTIGGNRKQQSKISPVESVGYLSCSLVG